MVIIFRPHRYEYLKRHPIINFSLLWNDLDKKVKNIDSKKKFADKIKDKMLESLV